MPLMLEIATVLAAIVGSYTNVVIIALMLLINALIGAAITRRYNIFDSKSSNDVSLK